MPAGKIVKPPRGASATLRSRRHHDGRCGRGRPVAGGEPRRRSPSAAPTPTPSLVALKLAGEALAANSAAGHLLRRRFPMPKPASPAARLRQPLAARPPPPHLLRPRRCRPTPNVFGLGYEEVDAQGNHGARNGASGHGLRPDEHLHLPAARRRARCRCARRGNWSTSPPRTTTSTFTRPSSAPSIRARARGSPLSPDARPERRCRCDGGRDDAADRAASARRRRPGRQRPEWLLHRPAVA